MNDQNHDSAAATAPIAWRRRRRCYICLFALLVLGFWLVLLIGSEQRLPIMIGCAITIRLLPVVLRCPGCGARADADADDCQRCRLPLRRKSSTAA
jgi:hypothetical protein